MPTLHGLVEEQARRTPGATALVAGERRLTYAELDARAAALAGHLGPRPGAVVGVCLERSLEMVVALLGVLKAGAAYLPIDPAYPEARRRFLLDDAAAPALVTGAPVPGYAGVTLDPRGAGGAPVPAVPVSPRDLAYVIYTSGSTGAPKGVMIEHAAIVNRLRWMQDAYGLGPDDRVLQKTPFTFDVSLWELFWPLLAGATLVVARPGGHRDPHYLARTIAEHAITTAHFVPSMLAEFLEAPDLDGCGSLSRVFCSGEALPADLADRCMARLGAELHNLYGPTEAAVDVSAWRCRPGDAAVPIGWPIANTRLEVLDADLLPVPHGVAGELFIEGVGLARGYLGRPDLTAERFLPAPGGVRRYRSGDLARRRVDGAFEFLGRIDEQVKLRGHRIEPGEIEAALRTNPTVGEAAVALRAGRLVAYVVRRGGGPPLRQFLAGRLPEVMVPAVFVELPALPRTPSGKLDRRALPDPGRRRPLPGEPAPAEGPVERELAAMARELLGLDEVGATDDLFELGAHSLVAAGLAARIRDRLGVEVPLEAVFEQRSVRALAGLAAAAPGAGPAPRPASGPAPLSFAQERIWFLQELHPDLRAYEFHATLRLLGRLEVPALEAALDAIVRRHEIYRTAFPDRDGLPVQVVHEHPRVRLPVRDWSEAALREELAHGFDLRRPPLARWTLLRVSQAEHVLVHSEHHLVHDGWSFNVFLRELFDLYGGGRPPEPPLQFGDYARWQRQWVEGPEAARQAAHWRRTLAGAPAVVRLPTDRPRPAVERFAGAAPRFELPADLCASLLALGREERVTPFVTLLAGFAALLARLAGQEDLCVGSGFAGRRWRELEGLLGMLVSTVVLRIDLSGDPSFRELVRRAYGVTLAALANQEYPLSGLVRDLQPHRDLGRNPLFHLMFSLHEYALPEPAPPGLLVELDEALDNGSAKMDLNVIAIPRREHVTVIWEHNRDLFDAATIERMAAQYAALLAGAAADPDRRLSELPLGPGDAEAAGALPRLPTWCLHERFAREAARRPSAPALTFEGAHLTYGELDARANRLAAHLRRLGVGPEEVVGVHLERSPALVVALLAVLKAGGAYLPLDPAQPARRLGALLRDAGAALLLTAGEPDHRLAGDVPVVDLDRDAALIEAGDAADPPPLVRPENAAYVIYTSGSTGVPKGVVVTHANVSRLLEATRPELGLCEADTWTLFHSFAFDFSVWELWGALAHGGRLVIVPRDLARAPEAFGRVAAAERVTVLNQTPSAFRQLAGTHPWRELRLVIFGGEALDPAALRPWARRHPRLVNMYGITETTVHVTSLPLDAGTIEAAHGSPIGRPLADLRAQVLDTRLRPVPVGVVGELYVGGAGLARGYLGRSDLTAERFLPDRGGTRIYRTGDLARRLRDGGLEYLGRGDRQVKVRGFRIEPEEVEAVLRRHPAVAQAAAFVRPGPEPELAACVVPVGEPPTVRELRGFLEERLPEFMVPSAFTAVDRLPLTPNGKLDRPALAGQAARRLDPGAGYVAPATGTEAAVAAIWAEVLGRDGIGAEDDFFDLGGHSLVAMRVVARLRQRLGTAVQVRDLFETPTVRGLAATIDAA